MKKKLIICFVIISLFLTGCKSNDIKNLSENIKKMELTGNLVTYEAYYHNVLEFEKPADSGITHILEKNRRMFAEYTGTIKLGIDMSKVKIDVSGKEINVTIPKAKILGEPNIDMDSFSSESFIESKDGLNKNPITENDKSKALKDAQDKMKEKTASDEELLDIAQKRAQVLIEENIKQFSGINENKYTINWNYE